MLLRFFVSQCRYRILPRWKCAQLRQRHAAGDSVFVNINHLISNSPAVGHELSIQGNAVGGAFTASANSVNGTDWFGEDGQPIAAAPFSVTSERVIGAMVVADARGSGTTHEIAFDVAIPGEIKEC